MADCQITGLTRGTPATFADYQALFQPCERPRKFSADEVAFHVPNGILCCGICAHWFTNGVSKRAVCEIMRLPDEANVPFSGLCRFWNVNGKDYPLLRVL